MKTIFKTVLPTLLFLIVHYAVGYPLIHLVDIGGEGVLQESSTNVGIIMLFLLFCMLFTLAINFFLGYLLGNKLHIENNWNVFLKTIKIILFPIIILILLINIESAMIFIWPYSFIIFLLSLIDSYDFIILFVIPFIPPLIFNAGFNYRNKDNKKIIIKKETNKNEVEKRTLLIIFAFFLLLILAIMLIVSLLQG